MPATQKAGIFYGFFERANMLRFNTPNEITIVINGNVIPVSGGGKSGIKTVMGGLVVVAPVRFVEAELHVTAGAVGG